MVLYYLKNDYNFEVLTSVRVTHEFHLAISVTFS